MECGPLRFAEFHLIQHINHVVGQVPPDVPPYVEGPTEPR